MDIICRKGGGLPQNYAETSSWLNPDPLRALLALRAKVMESQDSASTVLAQVAVIASSSESASIRTRRKHRRR